MNKGFTLIELLIVTLLIFCIGTFSMLGLDYINNLKFDVVVDEIYNAFSQARSISYAAGCSASLTYSYSTHSVTIACSGYETTVIKLPSFVQANLNVSALRFNGNVSPSNAGTFTMINTLTNRTKSITLRPVSGKITLY